MHQDTFDGYLVVNKAERSVIEIDESLVLKLRAAESTASSSSPSKTFCIVFPEERLIAEVHDL